MSAKEVSEKKHIEQSKEPNQQSFDNERRREFLKTSMYATYVVPAVLNLLLTDKAVAQSLPDPPDPPSVNEIQHNEILDDKP